MEEGKPKTVAELKKVLERFSLCASVDRYGSVTVDVGMGNGLYLSNAQVETAWLEAAATDVEDRGAVKIYHGCCCELS